MKKLTKKTQLGIAEVKKDAQALIQTSFKELRDTIAHAPDKGPVLFPNGITLIDVGVEVVGVLKVTVKVSGPEKK